MAHVFIVYPHRGFETDRTLVQWYEDAVANDEIEEIPGAHLREVCLALHSSGIITLMQGWDRDL